jgi:tRNA threonylcarbamoyladenosine biosynthesis protein TsaB
VKILAFDTSTEACSAALWIDGAVSAHDAHAGQRHSQLLLPMIDSLLGNAGIGVRALDAVAFGEGPGSFTGLRIACGVAQGLALGAGIPVVGIGTLIALAQACGAAEVACCLDARMGQVYFATYRAAGKDWACVHAPNVHAPHEVPCLPAGSWVGCGNGFEIHGDALRARLGPALAALAPVALPHARDIAVLAAAEMARGGGKPAAEALPVYVRDKVALTVEEQR